MLGSGVQLYCGMQSPPEGESVIRSSRTRTECGPVDSAQRPATASPRLIALHLPQFHPVSENDTAWERGFTEWTHMARARRLYPGHDQPRFPADLGYYDLRLAEARIAQAELARQYGIEGFCYWHYWFAGRQLLERPVQEIVASGEPDFPFCIAWANASWTGIWYGAPGRTLVEQTYPGVDDHERHFHSILPTLSDPRYMRVDDKPLLLIFQPLEIPDVRKFCDLWRNLAARAGLPGIHLVGFGQERFSPANFGFDGSVLHVPRLNPLSEGHYGTHRLWHRLLGLPAIYSYRRYVERGFPHVESHLDYPVAVSNWDNTPRAGRRGSVLHGSTPKLFARHLRDAVQRVADRSPEHQIVFIKSWNEWAEGNYLEPDLRHGRGYLEAVRKVVAEVAKPRNSLPR